MDESILLGEGLNLWIRLLSDILKFVNVLELISLKFFGFILYPIYKMIYKMIDIYKMIFVSLIL